MKLLYLVESGESKFLVFDEMPDKISTKYGDDTIIGRIGGIFYDFLAKRNERREAFGGRKFDIVLDNGEIEKCEGQWWDAVTDRAREELEKEGNPFSKMMLIGVSSVDRLSDCYVYYGLWASESKIEEMIADYKGHIYEYYEFKEEVINKINETRRKSYIQSWKEQIIRSGMRQKRKDVFESPDGLYIEMVYENKAFVPYRPIKETQDLPIDVFSLGIVDRWKRESEELIAELEKLCGKKWVNPHMPEKERFTLTLTDEERLLVEERIKAGYYSAESIEKRREEAHKAKMSEKRAEICERYDKKIRQAEAEKKIMLCVFDYGLSTDNVIYYSHTNTLSFNWDSYGEKITQEEFDDFVNKVDRSQLPEGIKFELK